MENNIQEIKKGLIDDVQKRLNDGAIEPQNAETIIRLINLAPSIEDAQFIQLVGVKYYPTGFHFDCRLEKFDKDSVYYFEKNDKLSIPAKDESKPIHKLIIGDNYRALFNLLIQYRGKIDVIYIDPPYGKDSMGEFADTSYNNDISRDNLLSMLEFRLRFAKQLLSDTGVIFCSIDDKNQAYVKCLFDDVFRESNFIATYLWKKTDTPPSLSNKVRKKYEYVLCYSKNPIKSYKFTQGFIDGDDAPLLNSGNTKKEIEFPAGSVHFNIADGIYNDNENMKIQLMTPVVVENGTNKKPFKAIGNWKWSQDALLSEVSKGTYFLVKSLKFSIRYQRENIDSIKIPQNNLDSELGIGTNEDGDKELKNLFGEKVFDNPKPVSLVKFLIKMTNKDDDIKILDFFAGSGTTGQAVLELNREDGGQRQFILVQSEEGVTPKKLSDREKTIAKNQIEMLTKQNLPLNIASITNERLRRVLTGKANNGTSDFSWIKNHTPFGDGLDVYNIKSVLARELNKGKTAFDVIDETLYGKEKMNVKDKIEWVCNNFRDTHKSVEEDEEYCNRLASKKI